MSTTPARFPTGIAVQGASSFDTAFITNALILSNAAIGRTKLAQDTFQPYGVDLTTLRVWDDLASLLPGTAATDDLAIIEGTFGTDHPMVQSSDAASTSVTQYARFLFTLPPEYDAGQSIRLRIRGAMQTVSDTSASLDVEAYAHDGDGAVGSDLCTTSAEDMNSATHADYDFDITPTGLAAGDQLDIRISIAITDSATGSGVVAELTRLQMQLDIRG